MRNIKALNARNFPFHLHEIAELRNSQNCFESPSLQNDLMEEESVVLFTSFTANIS